MQLSEWVSGFDNRSPTHPFAWPLSIFHPPSSILYAPHVRWNKITIVGVGLLGGSLGLTIKRRRLADKVVGYVRRAASVAECEHVGAVDLATRDLCLAVKDADLIILCTPLTQMQPLVKQMLLAVKRGAIVTDVGSVKASVVKELETLVAKAGAHFIGSHPMAGAEKTGVSAARADLFVNSVCVTTPTKKSNQMAARKVEKFWQSVGARTLRLDAIAHDVLVSRSSHLPHVVAATLAGYVLKSEHPKAQAALCANGFRDTTRVASGSPEMWRDIAMANRRNLSSALTAFIADLKKVQRALANADVRTVTKFLETAKQRRDRWRGSATSPSPE